MKDGDQEKVFMDLQNLGDRERSLRTSVKLCLYEVLLCLFNYSNDPAKISESKKFSYMLLNLFQAVQMISILSVAENNISLWSSYGPFWDILQYLRVDFIFNRLGFSFFFSILVQASILFSVLLFLLLLVLVFYGRQLPSLLRKTTSSFFALYASLFPIPCAIVLLSNSFFFLAEKHTSPFSSVINIPLALLCLVFFLLINFLHIIATSETRHSFSCLSIDSKSSCVLDLRTLQIRVAILAFYVLRGSSNTFYLSIAMFLGEGLLSLQFFFQKPYYNDFANKTKVSCCSIVSLSGLAMGMGIYTNNAGVFVLISYIANPLILICLLWIISDKIATKPSKSFLKELIERPRNFKDSLEVERILRPYLTNEGGDQETKERVLSAFDAFFYKCSSHLKDSRLVVWEASFCLSSLDDERLSRIKLSKRMYCKFSFEGDFQAFLFLKRLQADDERYFQDFDFLQFRLRLQKNKVCDQQVCQDFLFLMEKLTELSPPFKVVSILMSRISETLRKVNNEYDDLCVRYNKNKELLNLYYSFLSDIMRDKDKALYIQQKHGQSQVLIGRKLNWFDEMSSILIISGSVFSLGKITFANENASWILKEPKSSILGKSIQDFIPFMDKINHPSLLKKFLFFSKNTKIRLPRSSFLKTSRGMIVEVYIKLRCLAIDSYPMFLVLFKTKKKGRDLVLTDDDGNITQFSENIPSILKMNDHELIGKNLKEILQTHGTPHEKDDNFFYSLNECAVYYRQVQMVSQKFNTYRFYRGRAKIEEILKRMLKIGNEVDKDINTEQISTEKNPKRKKAVSIMDAQPSYDESLSMDTRQSNQIYILNERKSASLNTKTKKNIKYLIISIVLLFLLTVLINISNSLYTYIAFDGVTYFTSLYKIWNLNNALMSISNSANNFKRTSESIYKESFLDHIQFFEKFVTKQKEIIDVFHRCGQRYKIYDDRMFYWEKDEIKTINLVDFSNKFVRYSHDFFEQRETNTSFTYIALNSNSYPMEYMQNLSADLIECIQDQKSQYESMLFLIIFIGSILKLSIIALEVIFSLRMKQLSISYWKLTVDILSKSYVNIQCSLFSRLDVIHGIEEEESNRKSLNGNEWKVPNAKTISYVWTPVVLLISSVVYFITLYFVLNKGIIAAVYSRIETINAIGKMNFEVQRLNYWTRETMLPEFLENELAYNIEFKDPRQNLEQIYQELAQLNKNMLKKKSILLLKNEFDLFHDKIELGELAVLNGIYGSVNFLLMESKYYSNLQENLDSEYEKFNSAAIQLTELQEKLLHDTVGHSTDYINDLKLLTTIFNIIMIVVVLLFVLMTYVPFIKAERKRLEDMNQVFNTINKI